MDLKQEPGTNKQQRIRHGVEVVQATGLHTCTAGTCVHVKGGQKSIWCHNECVSRFSGTCVVQQETTRWNMQGCN
jgi:hypothetical protein